MLTKTELRKEVEKAYSSYKPEELFFDNSFKEVLQAIATGQTREYNRVPIVSLCSDPEMTACTNGLTIEANPLGPMIKGLGANWEKYMSNVGQLTHECGHILFTDFPNLNRLRKNWVADTYLDFSLYKPSYKNYQDIEDELNNKPIIRNLFCSIMNDIANQVEDIYIEQRLYAKFSGIATSGLALLNKELYKISEPIDSILESLLQGKLLPVMAFQYYLQYIKAGYKPKYSRPLTQDEKDMENVILDAMKYCDDEIDALSYEQEGVLRCKHLNTLFCKLYETLMYKEEPEHSEEEDEEGNKSSNQSQNSQNKQSQGSSSMSEQQAEEYSKQQKQLTKNQSRQANGITSAVRDKSFNKEQAQKAQQKAQNVAENGNLEANANQQIKEVLKQKILEEDEKQHAADLKSEAKEIEKSVRYTEGKNLCNGFSVVRSKLSEGCKTMYENIFAEVGKASHNLARKIANILKDREVDSPERGYMFGQQFNPRDVVNKDGKYFSRINEPDGKPSVAFSLLIDESGSMYGNKIFQARKIAVLLENTLRELETPFMVMGHNVDGSNDAKVHIYADFDTSDGKDKYRLASIHSAGCNNDGGAITYASEKLLKRPERQKILIVISDGCPTATSFYSGDPDSDTMKAIAKYRKKGIKIFGAVVDDWEQVSRLYGDNFSFDCREYSQLEKQLLRLIKKYCLI